MRSYGIFVSAALAALIAFSGCEKKESESRELQPPVAEQTETKEVSADMQKSAAEAIEPAKESETTSETAPKEMLEEKASAVEANVTEALTDVKEKASEVVESVKEEAKEATAAALSAVTGSGEKQEKVDAAALYKSKCSGCHGSKGQKHALGKSNILAGQSKELLKEKMEGYKNGSYGGAMKQIMSSQISSMSEEQIEALADYISKL